MTAELTPDVDLDGDRPDDRTVTPNGSPGPVAPATGTPATDTPAGPAPASRAGAPAPAAWVDAALGAGRWLLALVAALVIFGAVLLLRGVDPLSAYGAMVESFAGDGNAIGETLVQSAPFLLAALAVALPARAGRFNIGGEGQLLLGAIFALGAADVMGNRYAPIVQLTVMGLAGMAGGALWAAVPAALRQLAGTSEAISTLLLNYVATLLLEWLVHGPWKDGSSLGFPQSRALELDERFPVVWGARVHAGIVVPLAAAVVVWAVVRFTPWGFRLRVVGGNAEAARRAGFRVGAISVGAMVAGGALAGLAGMVELSGVEGQLRPSMLVGYGFIGFLASWLVRHHPIRIIGSAVLMAALAVGANGLKASAGLSGAAVYVLMAVLLLAILGWGRRRSTGAAASAPAAPAPAPAPPSAGPAIEGVA